MRRVIQPGRFKFVFLNDLEVFGYCDDASASAPDHATTVGPASHEAISRRICLGDPTCAQLRVSSPIKIAKDSDCWSMPPSI